MAKFLNLNGLNTLLNQIKQAFSTKEEIEQLDTDTTNYVTDIDYSLIAFDTSEIVSET